MTTEEKKSWMEKYIRLQNESLLSLKAMLEGIGFNEKVSLNIIDNIQRDVFSGKKGTGEDEIRLYIKELSEHMPIMAELGELESVEEGLIRSVKLTKALVWRIQENYARLAMSNVED